MMEVPKIILRDKWRESHLHGTHDDVSRASLSSNGEMLLISQNTVYWYQGGILNRKLSYDTEVINAFFSTFTTKGEDREKKLVVVFGESTQIYGRDGQNHVMSFAFRISKALPYDNGVVLDRGNGMHSSFMTISEPMKELGVIVSSSTSLLSASERLILFPNGDCSIAVTFDEYEGALNIYHVRFLNRSATILSKSATVRRKASQPFRRTSHINNHEEDAPVDEIKIEKKRNASHSEAMSIDRMASYDFNGNIRSADTPHSGTTYEVSMKKDAILSKLQSIPLHDKEGNIGASSMVFDSKEAVILKSLDSRFFHALVFESSTSAVSVPRFIRTTDLSEKYTDFGVCDIPGFCLLLSKENELVLFNPVLQMSTSVIEPSDRIVQILDIFGSNMVARDKNGHLINYELPLGPKSELVERCLNSLKYITNSYTFNYILLTYINAYALILEEWEAFMLTILVIVLPYAVKPSSVDSTNIVSSLLSRITPLQMRALEDEFSLSEMAPNIVTALHVIREDLKLNILEAQSVNKLGLLLAQLTYWMSWNDSWKTFYGVEAVKLNNTIRFRQPQLLTSPPDLLRSLTSLFDSQIIPFCTFSQLSQEDESVDERVTPRTHYVMKLFEVIMSPDFSPTDVVHMLGEFKISLLDLETFPIGIVVPLKEVLSYCQEHLSPLDQSLEDFGLIDRKDLEILRASKLQGKRIDMQQKSHIQTKDISQIVSAISKPPYHTAPIEEDRLDVTRHIFNSDRRFWEITKLLETSQIQSIMAEELLNMPEQESLNRQKDLATLACIRTLTMPIGKSLLFYSMKSPLTTEIFPLWKMNFTTVIQPENMTVSPNKEAINACALQWGYFHNGAANGLTISKDAKGITGSWITFNKSSTLTAQHAGFLLGLGLNGHLKSLEEWNIYNYLGPKHTFTSVGLLLGMSASLRGTMDVKLTRVLSVHVVALLPQGASDLIVSTPVQAAGLMGIGLLYLESQHRRMSEILLSQVNGTVIVDEKRISDESYRLAAGIALGYVNLGQANDPKGFSDTHVVDKLIDIAVSMKDVQTSEAFDKSMAGAILALAFIYLKTNDETLAKKLSIPQTEQLLDYVRPDLLLLRALAKNLIMWDYIGRTETWIESQIPLIILEKRFDSQNKTSNLNYFYIISGLCLVMGIKFASTSDLIARDTIMHLYDQITVMIDQLNDDDSYEAKLTNLALTQAQTCMIIAMSLIMAATGDLKIFRRLRILHGKFQHPDQASAYGKFMATNMALGFLFLGGGQYAINTSSNFGVASLITAIYPLFPRTESDADETHLQALRHFWSMAVEPRCLVTRDVESCEIVEAEVTIDLEDGSSKIMKTPNLLPPLHDIARVSVQSKGFFDVQVEGSQLFKTTKDIFLYKKQKIAVIKKSVKVLLKEINAKFEGPTVGADCFLNFKVLQGFKKQELKQLLGEDNTEMMVNIFDRQLELSSLARKPKSVEDLWNLKLIFSYYDKILSSNDCSYLSLEFVDNLKDVLWSVMA
jgi:anaphase-promoting complex subunit 1